MQDADVLDLVPRWAAAEQDNDPARLDRLPAPAFVGVGAAKAGRVDQEWRVTAVHSGARREAPAAGGPR
jgi:hypothetical protein